jgi:hypothetical protein
MEYGLSTLFRPLFIGGPSLFINFQTAKKSRLMVQFKAAAILGISLKTSAEKRDSRQPYFW